MRGRSAVSTDLEGLYAAQRLTMVRLAALLVGDRDVAESVVQRAFLVLVRRHDRRADPGTAVAELRSQVVAGCRAVLRGRRDEPAPASVRDTTDDVRRLPPRQREVVVLEVWARLSRPQTAATLRVGERTVAAARTSGARRASPTGRAGGRHGNPRPRRRGARAAGRRHRRRRPPASVRGGPRRGAGGRHASVAGGWSPSQRSSPWPSWWPSSPASSTTPARLPRRPPPSPSATPTQSDSPLSSPALAPGERTRGAIPWSEVGAGWAVIATAAPPPR